MGSIGGTRNEGCCGTTDLQHFQFEVVAHIREIVAVAFLDMSENRAQLYGKRFEFPIS